VKNSENKDPNCFHCRHFYITWDASFPRGCRQFGFKGRELPSKEVRTSTGSVCPSFEKSEKTTVPKHDPSLGRHVNKLI